VTSAATNVSLRTGGVHPAEGTHPAEEVRAPDNQDVNENGNVVRPATYGNGEVIASWDAAPVTAAVALSADTPGPVAATETVHLTARVTTSTGATAVGLVILVDNGLTNLGQAYLEADGSVTFALRGSQLPKAGNHITAFYQDYYGVIASVTSPGIDVARARLDQTVSFTSTAGDATTDAPYSVSATASSGLPVSFSIDPGSASVCSIEGQTVTFLAAGSCTIDAGQEGNITYNPAPTVQQQVQVAWGSNPIPVDVSAFGYQTEGGSPHFRYSATGPPVAISGTLTCTGVEGGVAIDPGLAAGIYKIDLSSCCGLTVPDHYALNYVGETYDFTVARPAIVVTVTGSQTYGGTPTFTYTDDAPEGVTLSGSVTCTSADNGAIYPEMPPRTYNLSECSGLRAPIGYQVGYAIGQLVVNRAVINVTVSGEQGYGGGSKFTFTDDYPGDPIGRHGDLHQDPGRHGDRPVAGSGRVHGRRLELLRHRRADRLHRQLRRRLVRVRRAPGRSGRDRIREPDVRGQSRTRILRQLPRARHRVGDADVPARRIPHSDHGDAAGRQLLSRGRQLLGAVAVGPP
jgi:hypothetical protein